MTLPDVHQFLPSFGYRDAVGNHTLSTQVALARYGYGGSIWAEEIHSELLGRAQDYRQFPKLKSARKGGGLLLYQASTGSGGMADFLSGRSEKKLMYYHNITPAEFFEPYDATAVITLQRGRIELARLSGEVSVALANSTYSAQELTALGVPDVVVCPPYVPPDVGVRPNAEQSAWLRKTKKGIDVLFVGRVVPNKGHLHLLRAFAALRAGSDHQARLFCIGAWGPPLYMDVIRQVRNKLGNDGVIFTGAPSDSTLVSHFQAADVFLCLSEHEGFLLPLVSAMRAGLPIVAYDAGAVAETLGGSGVLLKSLDPLVVAEVVARVATDESLRAEIVERQRKRLAEIENVDRDALIVGCVEKVRGL